MAGRAGWLSILAAREICSMTGPAFFFGILLEHVLPVSLVGFPAVGNTGMRVARMTRITRFRSVASLASRRGTRRPHGLPMAARAPAFLMRVAFVALETTDSRQAALQVRPVAQSSTALLPLFHGGLTMPKLLPSRRMRIVFMTLPATNPRLSTGEIASVTSLAIGLPLAFGEKAMLIAAGPTLRMRINVMAIRATDSRQAARQITAMATGRAPLACVLQGDEAVVFLQGPSRGVWKKFMTGVAGCHIPFRFIRVVTL